MKYTILGKTFNVTEEAGDCFNTFNPDHAAANDRSPWGMVEEMKTFVERTEDKKNLVDVGALFGIYSLVFTDAPQKSAVALEPSPWAYPILIEQVKLNPDRNIAALQTFAGATTGKKVDCGRDWKHVIAGEQSEEHFVATTKRLDDLILHEIDCIKIDVEGYEVQVLKGAERLIRTFKPMIFLECHWLELARHGDSPESLLQLLHDYDYKVEYYTGKEVQNWSDNHWNRVICT